MSTLGTQANLTTTYGSRDTNVHGGLPTGNHGSPTAAEIGGDSRNFSVRDEVSAGNAVQQDSRNNVTYTNYNYANASAIKDIHGKVTSGGSATTNVCLKVTGGNAANTDDAARDKFTYTRGSTPTVSNYSTASFK
jgi:hypothetical protein